LPDNAVLADDVRNGAGKLLIAKGNEVTPPIRELLKARMASGGVKQPIRVLVSTATADDASSIEVAQC
jgi:hypothetical protein